MKRLHPPSLCELWRDKQAKRNGYSVKGGFAGLQWHRGLQKLFCG